MSQLSIFSVEQTNKTAEGNLPVLLGINFKDIELCRVISLLSRRSIKRSGTTSTLPWGLHWRTRWPLHPGMGC